MKSLTAVAALAFAFLAGALCYQVILPNAKADAHARRHWQYQCFEASGVAQVTERANKLGTEGWELVASAGSKRGTVWCFKRPNIKLVKP